MIKNLKGLFISLNLTVVTLFILIIILFEGAYLMPSNEEFQSIHSMPLIQWLFVNPFQVTWWLWASIIILILLTINTVFCSIDSILKKRKLEGWLMLVSPQVIHTGFLFILFAHLISSIEGFKNYGVITEGTIINVRPDEFVRFDRIEVNTTQEGYITDWTIDVSNFSENIIKRVKIRPNKPFFTKGIGIYVRDIQANPFKAALIEISKEPGALWALLGAILFSSGTIVLVILKLQKEKQKTEVRSATDTPQ